MNLESLKYICVEGPIGVGKTTLVKKLAERLQFQVLLEEPEKNIFLKDFYSDPKGYRLKVQLAFLLERSKHLAFLLKRGQEATGIISDFGFFKDIIFSDLNLDARERDLYLELRSMLIGQAPSPDLVIYLEGSDTSLSKRVNNRGADFEVSMTDGYVFRLAARYQSFFEEYNSSPVVRINTDQLNLADCVSDLELVIERIRNS